MGQPSQLLQSSQLGNHAILPQPKTRVPGSWNIFRQFAGTKSSKGSAYPMLLSTRRLGYSGFKTSSWNRRDTETDSRSQGNLTAASDKLLVAAILYRLSSLAMSFFFLARLELLSAPSTRLCTWPLASTPISSMQFDLLFGQTVDPK